MKRFLIIVFGILGAVSAFPQSIRVTFNNNRDYRLQVDGRSFSSNDYQGRDVVVSAASGLHTVSVFRTNKRGRSKKLYASRVSLSPSEEVHLTVSTDGSISREESSGNAAYGYRSPMTARDFDDVYRTVQNQWGQAAKLSEAKNAFNSGSGYFSTDQAERIIELLNAEADRLALIKLAYPRLSDPQNVERLSGLLRSTASRDELDNYIRSNNGYDDQNKGYSDQNSGTRMAMDNLQYERLYQEVANQNSTSRKLSKATGILNRGGYYFTVSQAVQLISLVNGENNRLQLAKLSLDNIVDPENSSRLFDLLSTASARQDLDDYMHSNGYAGSGVQYNLHTAMSETDFNNLYNNIRKNWLPFSKYRAAVDAFSSSENYFTTAQARDIIALLSSEANRLDLAKLAYDNIVDQANFRQLYDLFTQQSSKDELDNYIRANYDKR